MSLDHLRYFSGSLLHSSAWPSSPLDLASRSRNPATIRARHSRNSAKHSAKQGVPKNTNAHTAQEVLKTRKFHPAAMSNVNIAASGITFTPDDGWRILDFIIQLQILQNFQIDLPAWMPFVHGYKMRDEGKKHEVTIEEIEDLMGDLRSMAITLLNFESKANSIQPTALIHTALRRSKTKGMDWSEVKWSDRGKFLRFMHRIMRQALVDHARKRDADRRPQIEYVSPDAIELYDIPATLKEHPEQIIALEDALERLTKEDAELADIIEFHYFSGINVAEIANLLEVSESTIKRNLKRARMVLYKYILEFLNGTD